MFNTIIEIKRENKEGQLNIKINLYHDNEKELNKIVKATSKFKFYNDTTITNNDGSLSYTKATNVITINNIAEELLDFDNNIKELEKLFIEVGAEPLILEGYLKATDKKEYKENMEKAGNNQNIEENTKNNNMENVLSNLEIEIKNIKKDIEVLSNSINIFNDNSILEEQTLFEKQIELDKKEGLYKKVKNFKMISRDNDNDMDFIRIEDNKKNVKYCLFYYKTTSDFSITIYKENKIIGIDKDKYNNSYIMNSKKEGAEKYKTYTKIGKDKKEIYDMLLELYKLLEGTN